MDTSEMPRPQIFRRKSHVKNYCCVTNCTNHRGKLDPRTGKCVRLHKFPDPVKEKERCERWIENVRRADLHFGNINFKKVCSVHFETSAYSYPSDISQSLLLPGAVPTIITDWPKPAKATARRPQKVPQKPVDSTDDDNCKYNVDSDSELEVYFDVAECSPGEPPADDIKRENDVENETTLREELTKALNEIERLKKEKEIDATFKRDLGVALAEIERLKEDKEIEALVAHREHFRKELDKTRTELERLKTEKSIQTVKLRREIRSLTEKLKRAKSKCVNVELAARKYVYKVNQEFADNLFNKLPEIPRTFFKILLKKSTHVNDWQRQEDVMKVCRDVYNRSSVAYKVLRDSGFVLPHPRTLQRIDRRDRQRPDSCLEPSEMQENKASEKEEVKMCVLPSLDGTAAQEHESDQDKSNDESGSSNQDTFSGDDILGYRVIFNSDYSETQVQEIGAFTAVKNYVLSSPNDTSVQEGMQIGEHEHRNCDNQGIVNESDVSCPEFSIDSEPSGMQGNGALTVIK